MKVLSIQFHPDKSQNLSGDELEEIIKTKLIKNSFLKVENDTHNPPRYINFKISTFNLLQSWEKIRNLTLGSRFQIGMWRGSFCMMP